MAQVIILSDVNLNGEVGSGRYMGAYAIASSVRKMGYETLVVDYFTRIPDFFSYISNFIGPETLAIGVSSTFLAPFTSIYKTNRAHRSEGLNLYYRGELHCEKGEELESWTGKLKKLMKARNPNAKLVLGGVKSQFAMWRPQAYADFDIVCLGAADQAFAQLVDNLYYQRPLAVKEQKGVQFLDNSFDMNNKFCPETLWTAADAVQPGESLPLEVARGCSFNCKFCHYSKKESFRKAAETLRKELIHNYENFGTTTYHFCDDCFNDHPQKVEAMCELFKSLPFKLEWVSYARVDVAVKFPHTLKLMVESGARGIYWGLESFNHEVARKAGKGTPPDLVKKFLIEFKNAYRGQCLSEGSFITGLPGEDRDSNLRTLDWLLQEDALDFVTIGPLGLMPYVADLDKLAFDYADYSRNPEKYGFQEVKFNPQYWRHETMDSIEAAKLAAEMVGAWKAHVNRGFFKTIWLYPHAKTLGYTHDEIMNLCLKPVDYEKTFHDVSSRFSNYVAGYHGDLLQKNSQKLLEQVI